MAREHSLVVLWNGLEVWAPINTALLPPDASAALTSTFGFFRNTNLRPMRFFMCFFVNCNPRLLKAARV